MRLILSYILHMLPYMALALPLALLWRLPARARIRRHGLETTRAHELGVVLFVLFLAGLASQTVIPRFEWTDGRLRAVYDSGMDVVNLELGRVFRITRWEVAVNHNPAYFLINFVGNVVIFIPIGFCAALLWRNDALWKSAIAGLGASLTIELMQLPQARSTDVDDLWINTLGAVLGWLLYRLLSVWFREAFERCRVREREGKT